MKRIFLAASLGLLTQVQAAVVFPGAIYESFADAGEVVALKLGDPSVILGLLGGRVTNITAGGGKVYYQIGRDIYVAKPDLSEATLFLSNAVAPADIAVDAKAGILYESFAGLEIAAFSLAHPTTSVGSYVGNATNLAVGGGKVYFQDGVNLFAADSDLSGVTLFHVTGKAPRDFAVDAIHGIYYVSFAGDGMFACLIAGPGCVGDLGGSPTNIAVGDDGVYYQDGVNIYRADSRLAGATLWHANGVAPNDIAFLAPILGVDPSVPEPASLALVAVAIGLLGLTRKNSPAGAL